MKNLKSFAFLTILILLAPAASARQKTQGPSDKPVLIREAEREGERAEDPAVAAQLAEKDIEVGKYYLKKKKYEAAISRFKSAVERRPELAEGYRLLGLAYERAGRPREAIATYRSYIQLYPKSSAAEEFSKAIERLEQEASR